MQDFLYDNDEASSETLNLLARRFAWRAENIYRGTTLENSSPLYEHLSREVAQDKDVLALVRNADKNTQVENLLFAAVHFLLLGEAKHPLSRFYATLLPSPRPPQNAYPYFRDFCLAHTEEIEQLVTMQRVQTNEVQRCTGLLPAFQLLDFRLQGRALALIELGCSAGLNLLWDKYYYEYGPVDHVGDKKSPVHLHCKIRGNQYPPISTTFPTIASRVGIDLNPIDVRDEIAIRWLQALIWPEHGDRAEHLMRAVEIACKTPPTLLAGDMLDLLTNVLMGSSHGVIPCIYHSYTLNQCSQQTRDRFVEMLAEFGKKREFYRISIEWYSGQNQPYLELYSYQNGKVQLECLAYYESHGREIEWIHSPNSQ